MWRRLKSRLRALLRTSTLERELDEELRFHLEKEIEQNLSRGMSPAAARQAALRSFGGVEQTKEEVRAARGVQLLEQAAQDLIHGLRLLRRAPGFTAVAVLSLALGIGASTALFSVADALLLATLPVKQPERLVLFDWEAGASFRNSGNDGWSFNSPGGRRGSSSFHTRIFETLRQKEGAVAQLFAFAELRKANLVMEGVAEVVQGQYASGGYFSALGVAAALGRTLNEGDDRAGAAPAAVLSHAYWQGRLGGDPGVLGKVLIINTVPFTIVGVAPAGFRGTMQVDSQPVVFVPVATEPLLQRERSNWRPVDGKAGSWWLHLMGRLRPGATVGQAGQSLGGVFQALALDMMPPPMRGGQPMTLTPAELSAAGRPLGQRRHAGEPARVRHHHLPTLRGGRADAADRLREPGQLAAGARRCPAFRADAAAGPWCWARPPDPPAVD